MNSHGLGGCAGLAGHANGTVFKELNLQLWHPDAPSLWIQSYLLKKYDWGMIWGLSPKS